MVTLPPPSPLRCGISLRDSLRITPFARSAKHRPSFRARPRDSAATMGGGNLQKSQMARERNQAKMGKEGAGGGGTEGMAKRHATADVFVNAQAERAAAKAAQEATRALKNEKAAAAERCERSSRSPRVAAALLSPPPRARPSATNPARQLAHTP